MMATSGAMEIQGGQAEQAARQNSPIAYGLGSFGLESTYKVFWGFYAFFYVDGLGLAVALAAVINVIYAIWDAVNDPLVGYLSDNTRTRWGRRRPWLLTGLLFYTAFLVLTYAVPGGFRQGQLLFLYAMAIILFFETAYTVMSVNYNALFPELFQGFRERTRASAYYQGFCMVGELAGFALPPLIYAQFGFTPMAASFAAVAGVSLLIGIVRSTEDPRAREAPPLDLKGAFGPVLRDRPFWMFAIALTFLTFTTGVYTLATPFWAKYTLAVTLGGIAAKPVVADGQIEIREMLSVTVSFDHDIVDGAPAARFANQFKSLIESGYGLVEQEVATEQVSWPA